MSSPVKIECEPKGYPSVCEGDSSDIKHLYWANWGDDKNDVDAHLGFWQINDDNEGPMFIVNAMQSNEITRGREMLKWLQSYGKPIIIVEAIPSAFGFYEQMTREELIYCWEATDGFPSDYEENSVPLSIFDPSNVYNKIDSSDMNDTNHSLLGAS